MPLYSISALRDLLTDGSLPDVCPYCALRSALHAERLTHAVAKRMPAHACMQEALAQKYFDDYLLPVLASQGRRQFRVRDHARGRGAGRRAQVQVHWRGAAGSGPLLTLPAYMMYVHGMLSKCLLAAVNMPACLKH